MLHGKINNRQLNKIIFFLSFLAIGGFFDWSVALLGVLLVANVIWNTYLTGTNYCHSKDFRSNAIYSRTNGSHLGGFCAYGVQDSYFKALCSEMFPYLGPFLFLVNAMVVTLWANDKMDHMMGIMRVVVVLLWIHQVRDFAPDERANYLDLIPYLGALMVFLSIGCYPFSFGKQWLWEYKRLSGFFQYANTAALFLVLGVIRYAQIMQDTIEKKSRKYLNYLVMLLLLLGLLLTGSRSGLLLLFLWGSYKAIRLPRFRSYFGIGIAGMTLVIVCAGLLLKRTDNIARLFENASTIWGRLLYARDGLKMLLEHPFGCGYLGYRYGKGLYATGVYDISFVHNDFLQIALDYGIIMLLLLVVCLVKQVVFGRQASDQKEMLMVVILAGVMDFSWQFMSIVFVLILCLDLGGERAFTSRSKDICEGVKDTMKEQEDSIVVHGKRLRRKVLLFGANICNGILFIAFLYLLVGTLIGAYGNPLTAYKMLPGYSQAGIKALENMETVDGAYELATDVITHNPHAKDAYVFRAYAEDMLADFDGMEADLNDALLLDPYDIAVYQVYEKLLIDKYEARYVAMASDGTFTEENGQALVNQYQSEIDQLKNRLEALKSRTSSLAYRINDKPQFEW